MPGSWDKSDFIELAKLHIGRGFPSGSMQPNIEAFAREALDHYDNATAEGKAYVDDWLAQFYSFISERLKEAPDSVDVRKLKRLAALGAKKHFEAKKFIQYFPRILEDEDVLVLEAVGIIEATLQCLLDILHDAMEASLDGPAKIATVGLAYWAFDEVTVAQYLARRNYSTLAYTHLRSIMEILDKMELFTKHPEHAALWASGDERAIWKELSPPRVREKLGRDNFDPVYRYFSEEGSHSTFTAMQKRLRRKSGPQDRQDVAIMIGGMKDPARQMSIMIYCTQLAGQAIIRVEDAFGDRLHDQDIAQMITKLTAETNVFYGHFLDTFDRSKVDIEPLNIMIEAFQGMRDRGEI